MQETNKNYPDELQQGFALFNQEKYYEAHEAFETAWRKTKAPDREFYRALLQISGGFFRLGQNRPKAAIKFFCHALKWLSLFPDEHLGVDVSMLKKDLNVIIDTIDKGELELQKINELLHPLDPQEARKS
jgi:predicted metal-dependent hydrolase